MSYISSNENRFYAQTESGFGVVPEITAANRIPAVKLSARQLRDKVTRHDKTGSRTFAGLPPGIRSRSSFRLRTYLTGWNDQSAEPAYGPLFRSAMGAAGRPHPGGEVAGASGNSLSFAVAHSLAVGQAVAYGGEIRFVSAVADSSTVILNAPFTAISAGAATTPTMTYGLADQLPSLSIFDCWSPDTAVQRVLCGAVADEMKVKVNADFHEFEFAGPAADLVDSSSFTPGEGGMELFPAEPPLAPFDYTIIPGHLGQVWMGVTPQRFYTLTEAEITLKNGVDLRAQEFGRTVPSWFTAGVRNASVNLTAFEFDDDATRGLYQAARQRMPVSILFQLGQAPGQLFGAYLKSVVPEVPQFDDTEARLRWTFADCRAEGTANDEFVIAFA